VQQVFASFPFQSDIFIFKEVPKFHAKMIFWIFLTFFLFLLEKKKIFCFVLERLGEEKKNGFERVKLVWISCMWTNGTKRNIRLIDY
jgi:hypothetical protein